MSAFDGLERKESPTRNTLSKTFKIDEKMYEKLQYLSDNKYNASVTKLVIKSLEYLIKTKNVKLYTVNYKQNWFSRSYLIDKDLFNKLKVMSDKYNVSIHSLVNIAIYNALEEEKF